MPRKLTVTAPHVFEVIDYKEKELGAYEVRVKTEYASGKHGTMKAMLDKENFKGQEFDQKKRLFIEKEEDEKEKQTDEVKTLGTTGTGIIIETGAKVSKWKEGDKVLGLMKVKETNICHEDDIWELGSINPVEALCVEPAYVSFHCIREGKVRYGDKVVVIGLGAIGLIAVQMAHNSGAETVIAVDPLALRREWAEKNGADYVINPFDSEDTALEIHELTENRGVDVAIEVAGKYEALNTAIRSCRVGGTVCSAGFYQGQAKSLWLGREWHHNRLDIVVPHGCGWGHPPRDYPGWNKQRAYDTMISLLRKKYLRTEGLIQPLVSLEETPQILKKIEEEPEKVIKYGVCF